MAVREEDILEGIRLNECEKSSTYLANRLAKSKVVLKTSQTRLHKKLVGLLRS